MADNNNDSFNSEDNKRDVKPPFNRRHDHQQHPHNQNKGGQRQMGRGQGNENQWNRKDVVKERLEMMSGPTTNLVSKEGVSAKKFTGRCRLFVGNLPPSINDETFRKMFSEFGEIAEVFLHPQKGYGFVKLVRAFFICIISTEVFTCSYIFYALFIYLFL